MDSARTPALHPGVRILQVQTFLPHGEAFHVAYSNLPPRPVGEHTHRGFAEFFLVLAGRLWHRLNGQAATLPAGMLVWVRERDTHGLASTGAAPARILNVAFPCALAEDAARFMGVTAATTLGGPGAALAVRLRGPARADFTRRLNAACAAFPAQDARLRVMLAEVLLRLGSASGTAGAEEPGRSASGAPPWLRALCERLQQPEGFLERVQALPKLAHKSAEHLARSFRKYLDTTPTDYLNARRLDHAAYLLASGDEKLLAIAYDCGFEQPGYFYRLFRKRFGVTPRAYRRRARRVVEP